MGDVAAKIRVMPESPEVDLEDLKKRIQATADVRDIAETPIAFGLKALDLLVVIPDGTEGGTNPVEEKLRKLEGVQSVETVDVTLV